MSKSVLNELCIKNKWLSPVYSTTKHDPDHIPTFHAFASAPAPGTQHMYKSNLQQIYAQKRNLLLPVYAPERYGPPPRASQFKCSVTINGQTYRSEELFPTLKDAEHSAAKVALQALQPGGNGVPDFYGSIKRRIDDAPQLEGDWKVEATISDSSFTGVDDDTSMKRRIDDAPQRRLTKIETRRALLGRNSDDKNSQIKCFQVWGSCGSS
ncbi:Double-stranded RNA-binding protein 4 [Linum perenne]